MKEITLNGIDICQATPEQIAQAQELIAAQHPWLQLLNDQTYEGVLRAIMFSDATTIVEDNKGNFISAGVTYGE